jgi:hypothetical protein
LVESNNAENAELNKEVENKVQNNSQLRERSQSLKSKASAHDLPR